MKIHGVSATIYRPVVGEVDRFGNATKSYASETVDNVLVVPGVTDDLEASRPEGVDVALTLHFPKAYTASLEGCEIELPQPWSVDKRYRVVGNPQAYIDANTPGEWDRPVMVEVAHG